MADTLGSVVQPVKGLRLLAARVVWALHSLFSGWVLVGWLLPWSGALWAIVVGNPLIHLQWRLLDDRCVLTIAEERLRGPGHAKKAAAGDDEDMRCVAEFLSRVLRRPVPHWVSDGISYFVLWGGFAVAVTRLWLRSA